MDYKNWIETVKGVGYRFRPIKISFIAQDSTKIIFNAIIASFFWVINPNIFY